MISAMMAELRRDIRISLRAKSEALQPVLFFLLVLTLFPIGIGPGPKTLQVIGPGVIWVAAILSAMLGMERLFKHDFSCGHLEQVALGATPLPAMVLAKVTAHWLVSTVPILLLSPVFALFYHQTADMYWALVLSLLLGTPVLSLVGAIAVALTLSLNKGGMLQALIILPVFIPLLIFATSMVDAAALGLGYNAQALMMAAFLLLSLALSPMAIAYAIRVSHY